MWHYSCYLAPITAPWISQDVIRSPCTFCDISHYIYSMVYLWTVRVDNSTSVWLQWCRIDCNNQWTILVQKVSHCRIINVWAISASEAAVSFRCQIWFAIAFLRKFKRVCWNILYLERSSYSTDLHILCRDRQLPLPHLCFLCSQELEQNNTFIMIKYFLSYIRIRIGLSCTISWPTTTTIIHRITINQELFWEIFHQVAFLFVVGSLNRCNGRKS